MTRTKRILGIALALLMLTVSVSMTASAQSKGTVKLAYVNWSEGIAMTNLAAVVLEDRLGYDVELTMADVAPVFTSVASGNSDAFLEAWLPITHASYMEEYGENLVDLGVVYENAVLGLVVPAYVEVSSIAELNDYKDAFGGEIVGIDAGAGMMAQTELVIEEYGLDFELLPGSGPVMTAALGKAIDAGKAIVVTGWAPHWMFARWDLKVLEDPLGIYGQAENIHKLARVGLEDDMPKVADFLKAFAMTDAELGDLMGVIEESGDQEVIDVARAWANDHAELIDSWLAQE